MTKDEFEAGYAERSGLTVAELHELGMHVEPCACGEEGCHGWQMMSGAGPRMGEDKGAGPQFGEVVTDSSELIQTIVPPPTPALGTTVTRFRMD